MSICDTCTAVNNVPECIENLTIGTITPTSQAVKVYFESIPTGRFNVVDATSDGSGLVVADLTTSGWIMSDHPYKLYIISEASDDQSKEDITVGATTDSCVLLTFDAIHSLTQKDFTLSV